MTSDQPAADAAVRTARTSDAGAVGAVQSQVWRAAYADLLPAAVLAQLDAADFARTWEESLRHPPSPQHRLLVATAAADLVGFAAVGPTAVEGRGELLVLGVLPDRRRTGHGSRLLNAAVDTLRANDFREMEAWLPAADEAARAFLTEAGLQADGAWRERQVDEAGSTVREVRLAAAIVDS